MRKILRLWTISFFTYLMGKAHSLRCPNMSSEDCLCVDSGSNINIMCPSPESLEIELEFTNTNHITLQCVNNSIQYFEKLPSINGSRCKTFSIEYCGVYTPVNDILQKLSVINLKNLYFKDIKPQLNSKTDIITKNWFSSLRNLIRLSFMQSNIHFAKDFLKNTPNLLYLCLKQVQLAEISSYFDYVPKLQKLVLLRNQISVIPNGTFKNHHNLTTLQLDNNKIVSLTYSMLEGLKSIEVLYLSNNNIRELAEDCFKDMKKLRKINLAGNQIKRMFNNNFKENNLLKSIVLGANNLAEIPENTFRNCSKLEEIYLNNNQLVCLPSKLFTGLKSLKELDASHNKLTSLPQNLFSPLENLERLDLSYNKLRNINVSIFRNLTKLATLDLHNNTITVVEDDTFTFSNTSEDKWNDSNRSDNNLLLDLRYNNLSNYPKISSLRLKELDLSFNQIGHLKVQDLIQRPILNVNLRNNSIKQVEFTLSKALPKQIPHPNAQCLINLDNNPIECDCSNYDLIRYNNDQLDEIKSLINITQKGLSCSTVSKLVTHFKLDDVECPVSHDCPHPCVCSYKPYSSELIVNCSSGNLTILPRVPASINLGGNQTRKLNVTHLDLSNNLLSEINLIPPYTKELRLNNNKIKNLNAHFISTLKNVHSLRRVYLKDNPWKCGCESVELQKYLMEYFGKVNSSEVYCQNIHAELVNVKHICAITLLISVFLPIILGIFLCFTIGFAIYYRYQKEIKTCLFAHNMCLCFISEEKLDKDKTYDVFISYAHQDEHFVVNQLLCELENGDKPFKVCIHARDWVPGQFISEQIFNSVKDSRRTLVVLSNDFLKSVWGKLEFRTAHTEAMTEGRARVIVVVYGNLDEDKLDEELKSYLKTNTYIKWGDKYFWRKLKYALPHSRNSFYDRNKRIKQINLKLGDELDLIKDPPSPCNISTPPIILNPSLLPNINWQS